jgi:D-sedoheptulose 7-phosphate isomerase
MTELVDLAQKELFMGVALHEHAAKELAKPITMAGHLISQTISSGGKLLICGNGGSAADAQHYAAEMVARLYQRERPAIAAIALTTDTSVLTAIANDYGFEQVFARQIEALGKKGDVLWAISTSGNSHNILAAIKKARQNGMLVVSFTGQGGKMADMSDVVLSVPSVNTMRIQEIHLVLGHVLCKLVEEMLFFKKENPDQRGS